MKENFYHENINAGFHLFPKEMLFHVENDYYEQKNPAEEHPEICAKACRYLVDWLHEMMMTSRADSDPMWTVIREGGPYHAKGNLPQYCERPEKTGRREGAQKLRSLHPEEFYKN